MPGMPKVQRVRVQEAAAISPLAVAPSRRWIRREGSYLLVIYILVECLSYFKGVLGDVQTAINATLDRRGGGNRGYGLLSLRL